MAVIVPGETPKRHFVAEFILSTPEGIEDKTEEFTARLRPRKRLLGRLEADWEGDSLAQALNRDGELRRLIREELNAHPSFGVLVSAEKNVVRIRFEPGVSTSKPPEAWALSAALFPSARQIRIADLIAAAARQLAGKSAGGSGSAQP